MSSNLRIGMLLNGLFGGFLFLASIFLVLGLYEAWGGMRLADRAAGQAELARSVFVSLNALRFERGGLRGALLVQEPIPAATQSSVERARGTARPLLGQMIDQCVDGCDGAIDVSALRTALGGLDSVRRGADAELSHSAGDGRGAIAKQFWDGSSAVISQLEQASTILGRQVRQVDPIMALQIEVKDAAYIVRDGAGTERNLVSDAIRAGHLSPDMQTRLGLLRGRQEAGWRIVKDLSADPFLPPSVAAAFANAEKLYYQGALARRDQAIKSLGEGNPSPVSEPDWQQVSASGNDAVTEVAVAALDAAVLHAQEDVSAARMGLFLHGVGLLAGLALGLSGMVVARHRIIRPVGRIIDSMRMVAGGDLSGDVPYAERKDEIGELAAALTVFKRNAVEREAMQASIRAEEAGKEARRRQMDGIIKVFDDSITAVLRSVDGAVSVMEQTAQNMNEIAATNSRQADLAAGAADQTSSNVQAVATATEEMASSIAEIARQMEASAQVARAAEGEAQQTDTMVQTLSQSAKRIGEVVNLIESVAGQTNLLALNATIEAARAGDAGKGFAVVAGEVKALANQTGHATQEITGQIGAMQTATEQAVQAIHGITATIARINQISAGISAAVEEQHAAADEITRNVQQAAQATGSVSAGIAQVQQAARATGTAGTQVRDASQALAGAARTLRSEIEQFLKKIEAI